MYGNVGSFSFEIICNEFFIYWQQNMWSKWTGFITAMVTTYLRFIYKLQHTVECYFYKQNTWASLELPYILKSWYGLPFCWGWTKTCNSIYKMTVGSKLKKPTNFTQSLAPKSRKLKDTLESCDTTNDSLKNATKMVIKWGNGQHKLLLIPSKCWNL
jgi:hypothetical protein